MRLRPGNFFEAEKLSDGWRQAETRVMAVWDSATQRVESPHSHPWLAELVFALDSKLRRGHAIVEYSTHPACIFRLEISLADRQIGLRDGTLVRPGQHIAQLHFWNEHIPHIPQNGATIRWAREMQKSIAISLRELSHFLSLRPDLRDISVICADVPSGTKGQCRQVAHIMAYYGFETRNDDGRPPIGERLHRFGQNVLISLIVFAHNAAALRLDTLNRVRVPIYLSRRTLERKFGNIGRVPGEAGGAL
jgi:hypothetical protein